MKDRVREAVFNLVGPAVKDKLVLDLFAGTGAMGLEAISRGAKSVIAVERSFPAAAVIRDNAKSLGAEAAMEVVRADVFRWCHDTTPSQESPWLVFCCPPYALYIDQEAEMVDLVERLMRLAPAGSLMVLEFDANFPAEKLPHRDMWDVRTYSPAVIAVYEHPAN
jgi:16S rRNA (guanine966-N2)-methyltransferase